MTAYFIYTRFYDFENNTATVGGIQTYLQGLFPVFTSLGYDCCVYQLGDNNAEKTFAENVNVRQVDTSKAKDRPQKIAQLLKEIMHSYNDDEDILVFMANEITCPNTIKRSIAIQHGIAWDMLQDNTRPEWRNKIGFAFKARHSYRLIQKLYEVKHLVCVDHNFPNWLRATTPRFHLPMTVIPNFTEIAAENKKPTDRINVIFARRFFPYRGTRLFAPAIAKVLEESPNVHVMVAGTGPDEMYIKEVLAPYADRVTYTQYEANEALQIHADKHIAVVPTCSAEGTSLSLLEAMSAQCAVVSTDVGGLSNIVIDGYNALYAEPTVEDLSEKISLLVADAALRQRLANNAYEMVKQGFSYTVWAEKWKKLILQIKNQ